TTLSASPNAALIQYGAPAMEQSFGLVTTATAPGKLYFNGGGDDLAGTTTLQPNTWYHAAVTYDGATVKLYLNGVLESSKATAALNTALDSNGLTIGLRPATSVWNGQIDEIDIFNRALSLAEIQAIYYAGAQGKCAPALGLSSAVSRKTHAGGGGVKDVPLPLTGPAGTESRNGSPLGTHTLVFTFTNSVANGTAAVTAGTGSVNGTPTFSGNTMTVNLTGVSNAQQITVTVSGVTDALGQVLAPTAVNMKALVGDVNGDSSVNSGDSIVTRSRSGQTTDATNFRSDVNLDGSINSGDAAVVRSASGTGI
ncbi:MAG TPA: LamG-like jellyroll fold domain-containing protein, partial [Chthoniobacterales bacterium]